METVGQHLHVEKIGKDVNHRIMLICRDCKTCAHAFDEEEARRDLAAVKCVPDCENCKALRHSYDRKPAVPKGGSCNDITHTCPNDGNHWWQSNPYFHLWQQVTNDGEWRSVLRTASFHQHYADEW